MDWDVIEVRVFDVAWFRVLLGIFDSVLTAGL